MAWWCGPRRAPIPADTIGAGGVVGGNRYGWFTVVDVADGVALDGLSLSGNSYHLAELGTAIRAMMPPWS